MELIELIAALADGNADAILCFGGANSRKEAERHRIKLLGASLSLHHEEFREKIGASKPSFSAQMK
jgi:hypothetical protein